MQIPAIKIASEQHWIPYVVDGNPHAVGLALVDYYDIVDLKDLDGLLQKAKAFDEQYGLDGVFTVGTDFSSSVAYIADALGLPSVGYEIALNATIKSRMRQCFDKAGVNSPPYWSLSSLTELNGIAEQLTFPLVMKPVDSMGGRGVKKIASYDELKEQFLQTQSHSRSSTVIVEKFIDGREFSLDAIILSPDEIVICGLAERDIQFAPYFIEMGHIMPVADELSDSDQNAIINTFKDGIKALGIQWGCAKGDIRFYNGKAYIGEIAARLSGGFMSGWTFPLATGNSSIFWGMQLALALPCEAKESEYKQVVEERAYISIDGRIEKINHSRLRQDPINNSRIPSINATQNNALHAPVRNVQTVNYYFNQVKVGDTVNFPRNNVEKMANIISVGDNVEEVRERNNAALHVLQYDLAFPEERTLTYLEADVARIFPPLSFHLKPEHDLYNQLLKWQDLYTLDYSNLAWQASILPLSHWLSEKLYGWHRESLSSLWSQSMDELELEEDVNGDALFSYHVFVALLRCSFQGLTLLAQIKAQHLR